MKLRQSSDTESGISGLSMFANLRYKAICTLLSPSRRVPHGF